jgi:hypothetical protein
MLAGFSGAILKSIQGIPTGIEGKVIYPTTFSLEQNFPNPFSSTTTIQYSLPEAMHVKVTVIDPNGRIIKTLIDQHQLQGTHAVIWNATGSESGVFFYEIEAQGFKFTKKMLLIK